MRVNSMRSTGRGMAVVMTEKTTRMQMMSVHEKHGRRKHCKRYRKSEIARNLSYQRLWKKSAL